MDKTGPTHTATGDPRIARTRKLVAHAVISLIQSKGVTAVTHQEVARAAAVGRATLYRHWPTVPELLYSALSEFQNPFDFPRSDSLENDILAGLQALSQRLQGPMAAALRVVLSTGGPTKHPATAFQDAGVHRFLECWNYHNPDKPASPGTAKLALTALAGPVFLRWLLSDTPLTDSELRRLVATSVRLLDDES